MGWLCIIITVPRAGYQLPIHVVINIVFMFDFYCQNSHLATNFIFTRPLTKLHNSFITLYQLLQLWVVHLLEYCLLYCVA